MTMILFTVIGIYLAGFYAQGFMAFKIAMKNPKSDYRTRAGGDPDYFIICVTAVCWPIFILPSTLILLGLNIIDREGKKK